MDLLTHLVGLLVSPNFFSMLVPGTALAVVAAYFFDGGKLDWELANKTKALAAPARAAMRFSLSSTARVLQDWWRILPKASKPVSVRERALGQGQTGLRIVLTGDAKSPTAHTEVLCDDIPEVITATKKMLKDAYRDAVSMQAPTSAEVLAAAHRRSLAHS